MAETEAYHAIATSIFKEIKVEGEADPTATGQWKIIHDGVTTEAEGTAQISDVLTGIMREKGEDGLDGVQFKIPQFMFAQLKLLEKFDEMGVCNAMDVLIKAICPNHTRSLDMMWNTVFHLESEVDRMKKREELELAHDEETEHPPELVDMIGSLTGLNE
jgi:hypothetical protein